MAETFIFSLFTNTEGDTVGNRREREGRGARGGGLGGALRGLGLLCGNTTYPTPVMPALVATRSHG